MPTTRQNKVAKLIQKDLADIFLHKGKEIYGNSMVTVTTVRPTSDLTLARIYISVFPSNKQKEVLDSIVLATSHIRLDLGRKIRHQLRVVPELQFFIDDSLDYIENIEKLLDE